jgi:hypothetical protein
MLHGLSREEALSRRQTHAVFLGYFFLCVSSLVHQAHVLNVRVCQATAVVFSPAFKKSLACIVSLFKGRGPSAILWAVWSVIVNTIKRVSLSWSRPDIGQKRREVVPPSFTNSYPAPTPILISRMSDVVAASAHIAPRLIFGTGAGAWLVSMFQGTSTGHFLRDTATTIRLTTAKMGTTNRLHGATVAMTNPILVSLAMWSRADYKPTTKSFTS